MGLVISAVRPVKPETFISAVTALFSREVPGRKIPEFLFLSGAVRFSLPPACSQVP